MKGQGISNPGATDRHYFSSSRKNGFSQLGILFGWPGALAGDFIGHWCKPKSLAALSVDSSVSGTSGFAFGVDLKMQRRLAQPCSWNAERHL
jgi:hypothetical protein